MKRRLLTLLLGLVLTERVAFAVWNTDPRGQGTDYAPELHSKTHRKGANDYLPHFLSEDEELGAPVANGDVIVAATVSSRLLWQRLATGAAGTVFIGGSTFSANLLLSGYERVGSASAPTNTTAGDLTCVRLIVGNAALGTGVEAQVTGDAAVTGWIRIGSTTAPTNTTAGDLTAARILAGDATLASGVVMAAAGNQTATGWLNVGAATAPSNTTAGDLTAKRAHFGTDGALTAGMELEVTGDAKVSATLEVGTTSHLIGKVTTDGEVQIGGDLNHDGSNVGFFGHSPTTQQALTSQTNNVTSGGVADTIANYTDLIIYANDAATIRNDIYRLALAVNAIIASLKNTGYST